MAAELSGIFAEVVGQTSWEPVIHSCEHPYDNVAIEVELLSDKFPELANREFYYGLSDE